MEAHQREDSLLGKTLRPCVKAAKAALLLYRSKKAAKIGESDAKAIIAHPEASSWLSA